MSYAPNYSPTVGFATEESNSVAGRSTVRTVAVDNELANISSSINAINTNIKLLQRSDGKIIDGIIEPYQFSEQTRALISTGGTPKGPWASATAYQIGDCVQYLSVPYLCHTAHTSSAGFDYGMWMAISGDGQSFQYAVNAAASAAGAAISESNAVNAANGAAASAASTSTYATQASSYANAASNSATAAAASAVTAETMIANSISGASQAEAEAGTDNAKYMSSLRVKQSIAAMIASGSLAANGYQKLPSGLIIQWGTVTVPNTNTTFSLPINYPNAHLAIVGSDSESAAVGTVAFQAFSTSQFRAISNGTIQCSYVSLGY